MREGELETVVVRLANLELTISARVVSSPEAVSVKIWLRM